ncbi:hypothetical protein [Citrobacter tructae]|uniref:hypothetical protein n=1 Tax=Citrobacter tructae TaxID=2562449 RepID=UPI003F56BC58
MYKPLAWFVTFLYVHIAWVFFRSHSLTDSMTILNSMFNLNSMTNMTIQDVPVDMLAMLGIQADKLSTFLPVGLAGYSVQFAAIACAFVIISFKNAIEIVVTDKQSTLKVTWVALISSLALYMTLHTTSSVFLYFNF